MNYKKIYHQLIDKARNENRTKNNNIYYESHHIVPEFMFKDRKRKGPAGHLPGNPNDKSNLILLTAREHFLAHVLLAKIFDGTNYGYSAGSALMFFYTKAIGQHARQINGFNSKSYERYRKLAIESISKARKGTMPCRDSETGEIIGSFPVDHPNILSGKWVHHSKGKKLTEDQLKNRKSMSGDNNTNAKVLTPEIEKIVFECLIKSRDKNNFIRLNSFISEFNNTKTYAKPITFQWIKNRFGGIKELVNTCNLKMGLSLNYNPYYRPNRKEKNA